MKRKFVGAAGAVVFCLATVLAGCSTEWIQEAEEIVAALIPAAGNMVALVAAVQGKGAAPNDMQMIQNAGAQATADLQLIDSLITAYRKADATAQRGILSQMESAIAAVEANLKGLLPALHIQDAATQAKVTAVVGIVLAEVESLAALLPIVRAQGPGGSGQNSHPVAETATRVGQPGSGQNSHPVAETATRMGQPAVTSQVSQRRRDLGHPPIVKAPLSAREFVNSYNAMMAAKTGNAELDRASAGLKIHRHGKAARVASAGWLK